MKSISSFFSVGVLALFLLALRLPAMAQAPAWQSARAIASATAAASNFSEVTATAVDAAGNIFLAGYFTNTVVLAGNTLTSAGNTDIFVAKFNPTSSQFVWAQRAGGTGYDNAYALAVNGNNIYVTGAFERSTADFGATALTSAGQEDVFVAKLTDAGSTGSFTWAQRAGGSGLDQATELAVSGTSVYVAGTFSITANFGAIALADAGSGDVFVAKLTDASGTGSFVWAQRAGGTDIDAAGALAVSGTSVYMAGSFRSSTASFGAITLTSAGISDMFVAKLTDAGSTGSFVWVQRAGGPSSESANALVMNGANMYVTGAFSATAGFGATTLTSAGASDVFVTKLIDTGSAGSFVWAQRAGGISSDQVRALVINGTSLYMTGSFSSPTSSFGTTLTSAGDDDVLVAKLNDAGSTGNFVWAQRAGGMGYDVANTLTVSGTSVYVAGSFISPTASFGTITLFNTNPLGFSIAFLASFTDATLTAIATGLALTPAQLFPNPAHGTATLRLPASTAPASLTLTDVLGRTVRRYPAPASSEATLDLRGLPAGLYLLRGAGPAQRLVVE